MATIHVTSERLINAPADKVYSYIADFRQHHANFLPPAFSNFKVEQGGYGAGTIVTFTITAAGRQRNYRSLIAEPTPGRVLTESDTLSSAVTTFTVTPEGSASRVRIETQWRGAGGLGGFFERLFAPRALSRLYVDELERLERYAREQG